MPILATEQFSLKAIPSVFTMFLHLCARDWFDDIFATDKFFFIEIIQIENKLSDFQNFYYCIIHPQDIFFCKDAYLLKIKRIIKAHEQIEHIKFIHTFINIKYAKINFHNQIMQSSEQFETKFLSFSNYKSIYRDDQHLQELYNEWYQRLKAIYRLNSIEEIQKQKQYVSVENLSANPAHSDKFLTFSQLFCRSQFRMSQQNLRHIQANNSQRLSSGIKQIYSNMLSIENIVKEINKFVLSLGKLEQWPQQSTQELQNMINSVYDKNKIDCYSQSAWKKQLSELSQKLAKINALQKQSNIIEDRLDKQRCLKTFQSLSDQIICYRQNNIKFKKKLIQRFRSVNQIFMKQFRELISVGAEILTKFSYEMSNTPVLSINATDDEYENCFYMKNSLYIKGLNLLRNLYKVQEISLNIASLPPMLSEKNSALEQLKIGLQAQKKFMDMKNYIVNRIDEIISIMQKGGRKMSSKKKPKMVIELESSVQVINGFVRMLKSLYYQIQSNFEQVDTSKSSLSVKSKAFSQRTSFNNVWPDKNHIWLWKQLSYQQYLESLRKKDKRNPQKLSIYRQKLTLAKVYCEKALQRKDHYILKEKCSIFTPFYQEIQIELYRQLLVIKLKGNKDKLIMHRQQIQFAKESKNSKITFEINNNIITIGNFQSTSSLKSVLKLLADNSCQSPMKDSKLFLSAKFSRNQQDSQKEEISNQQRVYLEKRKKEIAEDLEDLLKYQKYFEKQIKECDIRDVYHAIFTDIPPYFADKKYPTFFGFMANMMGDKNYETTVYDKKGPQYYTKNSDVTFKNCPVFSVRKTSMTHSLPKIPFMPSKCECHQTGKIYWIDDKQFVYTAEVRLTGSEMLENIITTTLYRIVQIEKDIVRLQIYGKIVIDGKNSFKSLMKKGAKSDMEQITHKVGYQIEAAMDQYRPNSISIKKTKKK